MIKRVVVIVALAFAVSWPCPATASTTGDHILLIGDSLLQSIAGEVRTPLERDGWAVSMQYAGGTGLTALTPAQLIGSAWDWQVALANWEAQVDPDVVVIVLGTNDVTSVSQGEDYGPHIDRLLSSTDAPIVQWADCSTHTSDPTRNGACATIHAELVDATKRRPGLIVLPYDEEIASVPANIESDQVHLTQRGQDAFAALVSEVVGVAPK